MERILKKILIELQNNIDSYNIITVSISKYKNQNFEFTYMYKEIYATNLDNFINRLHAVGYINKENLIPKKRVKKEIINTNKGQIIDDASKPWNYRTNNERK